MNVKQNISRVVLFLSTPFISTLLASFSVTIQPLQNNTMVKYVQRFSEVMNTSYTRNVLINVALQRNGGALDNMFFSKTCVTTKRSVVNVYSIVAVIFGQLFQF